MRFAVFQPPQSREGRVPAELGLMLVMPDTSPRGTGIFGHSMGGHDALVLAMRHPDKYRSLSAVAPIVAPSQVPWDEDPLP